jgi:hypothetical protein
MRRHRCNGGRSAVPLAIVLGSALADGAAAGPLYKCTDGQGAVSYQQTACHGAADGGALRLPERPPVQDQSQGDDHWSVTGQLRRMRSNAAEAAPDARAGKGPATDARAPPRPRRVEILNAIRRHRVIPGMTPDEVDAALGPPTRSKRDSGGLRTWSYRGVDRDGRRHSLTVRFRDGRVIGASGSAVRTPEPFDPDQGRWLE